MNASVSGADADDDADGEADEEANDELVDTGAAAAGANGTLGAGGASELHATSSKRKAIRNITLSRQDL